MNNTVLRLCAACALCVLMAGNASRAADSPEYLRVMAELQNIEQRNFYTPVDLATDGAGNVYVIASSGHQVIKISPAGNMTALAGNPWRGRRVDGAGAGAEFGGLVGIAADVAGDVYVADRGNHAIRKITPGGQVTTLVATAADRTHRDNAWPGADFPDLSGIALDRSGRIYVVDNAGSTVSELDGAGVARTFAGAPKAWGHADGDVAFASFMGAVGIATDGAGNLYVADSANCTIRKITPDRMVSTLAGSAEFCGHADGLGDAARFASPHGIAADGAGNVYVSDADSHTIRKITPEGRVTTLAGSPGVQGKADGPGAQATFFAVRGIATDRAGNVYVADSGNLSIRKITPDGRVSTLAYLPNMHTWPKAH